MHMLVSMYYCIYMFSYGPYGPEIKHYYYYYYYNESVHRKEEHASLINTILIKISTLLTLESLKWETFSNMIAIHE